MDQKSSEQSKRRENCKTHQMRSKPRHQNLHHCQGAVVGVGSQQLVLAIIIMLVVVVGLSSLSSCWCGGAAIIIGLVAVIVCSGLDGGADMMLGWCWCC